MLRYQILNIGIAQCGFKLDAIKENIWKINTEINEFCIAMRINVDMSGSLNGDKLITVV